MTRVVDMADSEEIEMATDELRSQKNERKKRSNGTRVNVKRYNTPGEMGR